MRDPEVMTKARVLALALALGFTAACGGSDSVAGPQGPAGAGTRTVFLTTANSSGAAVVTLPAAAGTLLNNPPVLACYFATAGSNVWIAAASTSGLTWPSCGLVFSGGVFSASMVNLIAGQPVAFVVVY